ncbi:MAG: hypothetical protein Q8911_00425 [Bacillota bacterium]|nr:hypothetical protein [Bacillota bacterium]
MCKPVKLLSEVMALAYLVNENTEYCAFLSFMGHVNLLKVQIAKSDTDYNEIICTIETYLDGEETEGKLLVLKSTLENYLMPRLEESLCMN